MKKIIPAKKQKVNNKKVKKVIKVLKPKKVLKKVVKK